MFRRSFALVCNCLLISLPIIQFLLFEQETPILLNFLLNFRNVLKHTEIRSSLASNRNIKEDIPTALEVFLCFETMKRDETWTDLPRKHPRNARVMFAEELGAMSLLCLSLSLIISWLSCIIGRCTPSVNATSLVRSSLLHLFIYLFIIYVRICLTLFIILFLFSSNLTLYNCVFCFLKRF